MSADQKADEARVATSEETIAEAAARWEKYKKWVGGADGRQLALALVPINVTDQGDYTIAGPPLVVTGNETKAQQKQFYNALTGIPWLKTKICSAVLAELGTNIRKQDEAVERCRSVVYDMLIDDIGMRRLRNGKSPPQGSSIYDAAAQELADKLGIDSKSLRRRLNRHGLSQESKIDLWLAWLEQERAEAAANSENITP